MTPGMMPKANPGMGTGGAEAVAGRVNAAKSPVNPVDASMMKQDGEINPDMPIRSYLEKFGIDVDGPVSQLLDAYKNQKQKAGMTGKMSAIAGAPGMGQPSARPAPVPGPSAPPAGGGGMGALLGKM